MVVLDFLREKGKAPMRLAHHPAPSGSAGEGFSIRWLWALLFAMLLMLAGCQAGSLATPSVPPVATAPDFPFSVTGDDGTAVSLPKKPEKIVSLMPGATETLYAMGAGDRVVGKVENIANFPAEAADVPVVATYQGVDVEKIVDMAPDLVIAGGNGGTAQDAIDQLRHVNVPVLVVYAADAPGVLDDITLIGQAVGELDAAHALTDSMHADFDRVAAATKDAQKPRVFYETGNEPALYGVADDSFVVAMLKLAGADPITTGSATSWEMPQEKLIAADPQVILLGDAAYGVAATDVVARPGWSTLTAVKNNAIYPIDDIVVTRPGPRLAAGLAALLAAIHPDLATATPTP